ncbi:Hypothetical protein NTJ_03272 [Nesidiocoris tenuis]|nr:Hypothetical protein NTJ_03272 [Nesidiocoris tenuis]
MGQHNREPPSRRKGRVCQTVIAALLRIERGSEAPLVPTLPIPTLREIGTSEIGISDPGMSYEDQDDH